MTIKDLPQVCAEPQRVVGLLAVASEELTALKEQFKRDAEINKRMPSNVALGQSGIAGLLSGLIGHMDYVCEKLKDSR